VMIITSVMRKTMFIDALCKPSIFATNGCSCNN
jgi:hypothetical protein